MFITEEINLWLSHFASSPVLKISRTVSVVGNGVLAPSAAY
jgi:hypothetical protein